jgi:hypothetical protein
MVLKSSNMKLQPGKKPQVPDVFAMQQLLLCAMGYATPPEAACLT